MKIKFLPVLLVLGAFLASCSSEEIIKEPAPDGAYADGFFVLNEGNFLSGNASVSFIENSGEVSHSIFKNANSGADLGDTATDLQFYEDYAFIVVNVSNKIEVVDRYTFESVATIDNGLANPRKISFSNGTAYVTNWGDASDPGDDFITVFDAETFQQSQIVPVAEGPENMLVENSRLFIVHLGGWGFNNIITVINTATN
ncbi:YncE family protein, partial [Longispora fulva]|uniref:YncE family protein n=3 Tax=Bacteria TaxID=2 RepID=UPI0036436B3A